MGENINTSPRKMAHLDFFKKFKQLKLLEPLPGVIGCFVFSVCLIFCLFLLNYKIVNKLPGQSLLLTWFKFNVSSFESANVGYLELAGEGCDIFYGNSVWDESYTLYTLQDCMFLDEGLRCSENGRPDNIYTKWCSQPKDCNLPREEMYLLRSAC